MMSLWDALRMNMMISYQELVRTFLSRSRQILTPCNTIRVKTMAMQTWLVLLLCIFFFSISVYSFISYLKDRRRQKLTFNDKRSMRRK